MKQIHVQPLHGCQRQCFRSVVSVHVWPRLQRLPFSPCSAGQNRCFRENRSKELFNQGKDHSNVASPVFGIFIMSPPVFSDATLIIRHGKRPALVSSERHLQIGTTNSGVNFGSQTNRDCIYVAIRHIGRKQRFACSLCQTYVYHAARHLIELCGNWYKS